MPGSGKQALLVLTRLICCEPGSGILLRQVSAPDVTVYAAIDNGVLFLKLSQEFLDTGGEKLQLDMLLSQVRTSVESLLWME